MLKRVVFILALLAVGPAPATWAAQERITFAYSAISPDMAGVWMAKDMGAFERHGLSVDLVYISSGATVIQALVGGSVAIETIFSIPGMGRLSYEAILNRDYPLIMAVFTVSALLTLVGILLSDVLYTIVDPRIAYDGRSA